MLAWHSAITPGHHRTQSPVCLPCQMISSLGSSRRSIFEWVYSWTRQVLVLQKLPIWCVIQSTVSLPTPHLQCFPGLLFLLVYYHDVSQITFVYWSLYLNKPLGGIIWGLKREKLSSERTCSCFWSSPENMASQGSHVNLGPQLGIPQSTPGCKSESGLFPQVTFTLGMELHWVLVLSYFWWVGCWRSGSDSFGTYPGLWFLGNLPCDTAHTVAQFHNSLPTDRCPEDNRSSVLGSSLHSVETMKDQFQSCPDSQSPTSFGLWLLLPHRLTLNQPRHPVLGLLDSRPLYLPRTHPQSLYFSRHSNTICKQLVPPIIRNCHLSEPFQVHHFVCCIISLLHSSLIT